MNIKNTNTLGVLRALCRRHHFVSGEIQDYLLERALDKNPQIYLVFVNVVDNSTAAREID